MTESEAIEKAQDIGALVYMECSALTQKNLKEVFDAAILVALDKKGLIEQSRGRLNRTKKYKCKSELRHSDAMIAVGPRKVERARSPKKRWQKLCCMA